MTTEPLPQSSPNWVSNNRQHELKRRQDGRWRYWGPLPVRKLLADISRDAITLDLKEAPAGKEAIQLRIVLAHGTLLWKYDDDERWINESSPIPGHFVG